jgi:hypothetical protein
MSKPVVLVTGALIGIGRATAFDPYQNSALGERYGTLGHFPTRYIIRHRHLSQRRPPATPRKRV